MRKTKAVISPFSGETISEVPSHNAADIEAALTNAYALYRDRRQWLPVHQRVDILNKLVTIMADQVDSLALQAAREGGKPLQDSLVEANRAVDGVRLAIETIRTDAGHVIPVAGTASGKQRIAFTQKEPIGVVVAVSAFNHPLNLIVHQVVAAVAAGCPVLVKPAGDTPMSCQAMVKMLHEAGLPETWCQFVMPESHELAEKMVTDPRVGFFSFIGSAKVGWSLRSKLAPGTRCAFEHGGVAPVILAPDADLELAVPSLTKAGFYHAGQVCVSVQRVFAHESIAETFAQGLVKKAKVLKVGDPALESTEVGPLIRPAEVERVHDWVSEVNSTQGQILCGGNPLDNNCYQPTVIFNPAVDAKVSRQEVFGPVVCVYPYEDLTQAIEQANSLPFSFQAAVFTQSLDTAMSVYRHIDASAVMVNDHTAFRVDGMPFAGLKESGLGVGGIPYTIEDMQIEKMMVIQSKELLG